jgi:hypothetical protein
MAGGMNRGEYDRLISTLGKRVFLLHNVHENQPKLFRTRWAMNYLAGPLTRIQVPALNELVGASATAIDTVTVDELASQVEWPATAAAEGEPVVRRREAAPTPEPREEELKIGSTTRPPVPGRIEEYFLPNNLTVSQAAKAAERSLPQEARSVGLLYRPVLLAQAEIRFLKRKYNLDYDVRRAALVLELSRRGTARWDDWLTDPVEPRGLDREPAPEAYFAPLDAPLSDGKILRSLKSDFTDWAYRTSEVEVRANEKLKIYAGPEVSQAGFRKMCTEAAREEMENEAKKVADSYDKKIERIEDRLEREERELREDEADLSQRKMEEWGTHAENVLGLFGGRRRRLSSSLSKRRMTGRARADVEESKEAIEDYKEDIAELEREKARALQDVQEKWSEIADDMIEIPVAPYKKDVLIELFGVAWMPYHALQVGGAIEELLGYDAA